MDPNGSIADMGAYFFDGMEHDKIIIYREYYTVNKYYTLSEHSWKRINKYLKRGFHMYIKN